MTTKRVLIVDDNRELRALIRMTLEFGDYDLYEAEDGEHAMRLFPVVKPDVMILDIMMPGAFDGLEVCRRIKSNSATADTKIVLLSAMGQKADIERGKEAGADAYLTKPFSPLTLMEHI